MGDNVKLKKGIVVEFEGQSYMILEINDDIGTTQFPEIFLGVTAIECKYCTGNLKKQGRQAQQYECESCHKLNWVNSQGEHVGA